MDFSKYGFCYYFECDITPFKVVRASQSAIPLVLYGSHFEGSSLIMYSTIQNQYIDVIC